MPKEMKDCITVSVGFLVIAMVCSLTAAAEIHRISSGLQFLLKPSTDIRINFWPALVSSYAIMGGIVVIGTIGAFRQILRQRKTS